MTVKTATSLITGSMLVLVVTLSWTFGGWLSEAWIRSFDNAGILLGYVVSCISVALGAVALIRRREIRRWLFGRRFPGAGAPVIPMQDQVRAIVIPVSRREQPEWILRHLRPEQVSLLYTRKTKEVAVRLAREFGGTVTFEPDAAAIERGDDVLEHPDDPQASRALVQSFLRRFEAHGVPRAKTFVDTTGGKVPMSIGAFQAAEELGVSSIYVVGKAKDLARGEEGLLLDPEDPSQGDPRYMSDRTTPPAR